MTIEGVDFSFARPGGAALVAAGKHFVVRYVPFPMTPGQPIPTNGGKALTLAEIVDYRAHGLGIALVFESTPSRALAGRAAGAADATTADAAVTALGLAGWPIYFAVDFDVQVSEYAAVSDYLFGVVSVLGGDRSGIYGGYNIVTWCQANQPTIGYFWQTYAWSGGKVSPGINLYQYQNGQTINGGAVDFDRAMTADYGQQPAGGDMTITAQVREKWHPTVTGTASNGVLRATPDRSAAVVQRVPATGSIITIAEVTTTAAPPDNNWRLVETPDRAVLYALRSDWISDGFTTPVDTVAVFNDGVTAGSNAALAAKK